MRIRDRVVELRRVLASSLAPHPANWRKHPVRQQQALRGLLAEVGYADALLARELPDGSLQLLDGHLRAETTPDQVVPVLVLDVNEAEARKLLATLDPLAGWAETDQAQLDALVASIETDSPGVRALLAELSRAVDDDDAGEAREAAIPESYQVVVECRDEDDQRALYERMQAEGRNCRVLTM